MRHPDQEPIPECAAMPKERIAHRDLWSDRGRLSCARCPRRELSAGPMPSLKCRSSGGPDHLDSSLSSDLETRGRQACLWWSQVLSAMVESCTQANGSFGS